MRQWLTAMAVLAALAMGLVGPARARPLDPALQQQLLALYHRYNAAIAEGKLDDALALRSAPVRTALTAQFKTPKDRQDYLDSAKDMVPDRLEVRHASENDAGDKALVIAWADKKLSFGQVQAELDMSFVRESGVWRLGDLVSGPGPSDIKHCDTAYQPISAYDTSHGVSLQGRIERVEFQPDHTLVVVLAGNTETCAFLPDRAALQQHGMDPSILQPFRVADISGVAQRNDAQKVMVNNITVHAEE